MTTDLVTYRARVGMNYSRSTRLPRKKYIDYDTFILVCLLLSYGLLAIDLVLILNLLNIRLFSHIGESSRTRDVQPDIPTTPEKDSYALHTLRDIYADHVIFFILILLLYLSGDVEKNPGPSSSSSDSDSNDLNFENFKRQNLLTFTCINIQSVVPKLDILEAELGDRDVILVTETWLKSDVPNSRVELQNYKEPYRKDRSGDRVGGV